MAGDSLRDASNQLKRAMAAFLTAAYNAGKAEAKKEAAAKAKAKKVKPAARKAKPELRVH